jgi:predicted thioesterase
MDIRVGMTATVTDTVCEKNTAETVGSGSLKVFATPAMVALMEKAACEAVQEGLDEGSTTVGTLVNVEHISATPLNMSVNVTATVTEVDGRKISFSVEAFDEAGLIGRGTHERFVVFSEKFMAKTESKGK